MQCNTRRSPSEEAASKSPLHNWTQLWLFLLCFEVIDVDSL